MSNATVELSDSEWQQVLGILALAPWRDANPLLMKIGEQLRLNQMVASGQAPGVRRDQEMDTRKESGSNSAGMGALKQ